MDSLNRHYLSSYGESWVETPNLDRLASDGVVFENHWSGSLPCMPARREMMTGRCNFLETKWGPIEAWDACVPTLLRERAGVYSHLITDHYHYFHRGGDGYHDLFDSWEFERGQEGDKWRGLVNTPEPPPGTRGKGVGRGAYWRNRALQDTEEDLAYPTPRCFTRAIDFLRRNHEADNWHLHLEVFDPHEPFDAPRRYLSRYGDRWDGPLYNWPAYDRIDPDLDDEQAVAHIRRRYAASVTMADAWLGRLLDTMNELDLWSTTTVILTTDHGHLLGEHGYWAKNYMFDYAELARIPLFVRAPGLPPGRRLALTTSVDLAPTILDLHRSEPPPHAHGRSISHLLRVDEPHHEWVLFGYHAKDVTITDGRITYTRQPRPGTMTELYTGDLRNIDLPADVIRSAEAGSFLPAADGIPHFRMRVPGRRHRDAPDHDLIFDLINDPRQESPVDDPELETRLVTESLPSPRGRPESRCRRSERRGGPGPR